MKIKYLFFALFIPLILSCEYNSIDIDENNLLLGVWINPSYNEDTTTFSRGSKLPEEGYGISFAENGTFMERTSGWCGTPPLTYFNIEGNFSLDEDLITIENPNYPPSFSWRIISVSDTTLVVKRELSEQEKDHRALMELFNEISELSYSKTCTNANDWNYTPYGSKACGGPQGFLPYSNKIDTVSFLAKIDAYTKAEEAYNIKWGVISTCEAILAPDAIECSNGYPVLTYN